MHVTGFEKKNTLKEIEVDYLKYIIISQQTDSKLYTSYENNQTLPLTCSPQFSLIHI